MFYDVYIQYISEYKRILCLYLMLYHYIFTYIYWVYIIIYI